MLLPVMHFHGSFIRLVVAMIGLVKIFLGSPRFIRYADKTDFVQYIY